MFGASDTMRHAITSCERPRGREREMREANREKLRKRGPPSPLQCAQHGGRSTAPPASSPAPPSQSGGARGSFLGSHPPPRHRARPPRAPHPSPGTSE
eukprot:267364-Rhodomonas_salina.7